MENKLVMLTTQSCGHCKTIKARFPDLECKMLETKEDMEAARQFGIMAVPVLLVRGDDETIIRAIEAAKGN